MVAFGGDLGVGADLGGSAECGCVNEVDGADVSIPSDVRAVARLVRTPSTQALLRASEALLEAPRCFQMRGGRCWRRLGASDHERLVPRGSWAPPKTRRASGGSA
jgi:hypothetical protein